MTTEDKYVSVKSGEIVSVDIEAPELATFALSGADLIITRIDGSVVVLQDFADLADEGDAAGIRFLDGNEYPADILISWTGPGGDGLGFMVKDQEEAVDLDALFDALNIAAKEGVDAMDFIVDEGSHEGLLTVHHRAFASEEIQAVVDNMNADDIEPLKDFIVSDES